MRNWVAKNPEKKKNADYLYRRRHLRDVRARANERASRNRERNRQRSKRWYEANKDRSKVSCAEAVARRRSSDLRGFRNKRAAATRRLRQRDSRRRFHEKMSRLVAKTLKRRRTSKQGKSWPSLVGYTITELEARLLETMPNGFCWDDYLSGVLEIDHIIPASVFNFQSPDDLDFKKCWALSNLRLLTKRENYDKRAKLSAPFQPALLLAIPRGAAV